MKISDLIKELELLKNTHGDIPVNIFDYEGDGDKAKLFLCLLEDEGKVLEITFGDKSFADAFR